MGGWRSGFHRFPATIKERVALGYFIVPADDISTPLIAYLSTLRQSELKCVGYIRSCYLDFFLLLREGGSTLIVFCVCRGLHGEAE